MIAVIGCGQWGKNLVRNFHQLGVLKAICEDNPETAALLSQTYHVPHRMLSDIMADPEIIGVAIATPADTHAPIGLTALQHGKHVFIEKPLALSLQEGQLLYQAAQAHQRLLMVGHLLRYHPAFLALSAFIAEGGIGRLMAIDAYRQSFGRVCPREKNVFWSLAPHDLSLILALAQQMPLRVKAVCDTYFDTGGDQGIVHLTFADNLNSRLFVSWMYPTKEQRLVVKGTHGTLVFDDRAPTDKVLLYTHQLSSSPLTAGEVVALPYENHEPLQEECRHFIHCIRYQMTPRTDGEEALRVLKILEDIDACCDLSLRP